jgi:hypothetical protein
MSRFRSLARAGATTSIALAAHSVVNLRFLRRAPNPPDIPTTRISVLLPARNEAHRIGPCLDALRIALERYGPDAELIVLDDESVDGTYDIVRMALAHVPRGRVIRGQPLPDGWYGKPFACHQLADTADPASDVLVFIDADVVLKPDALVRTVAHLRDSGLDLISPYPRQRAESPAERLLQPLLQWSWATLLPLRLAERSHRPSLTAANGQLLTVRNEAYRRSGGHAAVPKAVLEDIELLKAFKRSGFHGGVTDGSDLATCRMYDGWYELRDGYTKSLWAATGSMSKSAVLCTALLAVYVLPPALWFRYPADRVLAGGTLAAIASRATVAHRARGRIWPESATHPAGILGFVALTARSWRAHRGGTLSWKTRGL